MDLSLPSLSATLALYLAFYFSSLYLVRASLTAGGPRLLLLAAIAGFPPLPSFPLKVLLILKVSSSSPLLGALLGLAYLIVWVSLGRAVSSYLSTSGDAGLYTRGERMRASVQLTSFSLICLAALLLLL